MKISLRMLLFALLLAAICYTVYNWVIGDSPPNNNFPKSMEEGGRFWKILLAFRRAGGYTEAERSLAEEGFHRIQQE